MLTKASLWEIFVQCGALREGHFLLTSGRHSNRYIQCAQVLQYPHYAGLLAREIGERLPVAEIDVVIGPALGGILVAHEVARYLGARSLFAERVEGRLTLRRSFTIAAGEKVLAVEDVLTTGGSLGEAVSLAREAGGEVVAAAALVDRSGGALNLDVPVVALIEASLETYLPENCPWCRAGLPLVKPGSRKMGSENKADPRHKTAALSS